MSLYRAREQAQLVGVSKRAGGDVEARIPHPSLLALSVCSLRLVHSVVSQCSSGKADFDLLLLHTLPYYHIDVAQTCSL